MTNSLVEIEEEILGTALTTMDAIKQIMTLLPRHEIFQIPVHQAIYEQMLALAFENLETDLIAVNHCLQRKHGLTTPTGQPWMMVLTSLLPAGRRSVGNLMYKCGLLHQEYVRMAFAKQLSKTLTEIQDVTSDPLLLMSQMTGWLDKTTNRLTELAEKPFSSSLKAVIDRAELAIASGTQITGIATQLDEVDAFTKGFQPATMTILAARPSMGKTAVACQIAYNIAVNQKIPVALFSLEMRAELMASRELAIDTGIKNGSINSGHDSFGDPIDIPKLRRSEAKLSNAPLLLYDKLRTLPQIKARISQLISKYGNKILIIIDYLQLVKTGTKLDMDITARVSEVSRELKETANNYEIPILALAQLNREVEKNKKDKRPQLDHLNHSGSIEQDADNVFFLYSPSYYSSKDEDGYPVDPNLLYLIVAKNRSGSKHTDDEGISLSYDRSTNQVKNYSQYENNISQFENSRQLGYERPEEIE